MHAWGTAYSKHDSSLVWFQPMQCTAAGQVIQYCPGSQLETKQYKSHMAYVKSNQKLADCQLSEVAVKRPITYEVCF